MKYIPINLRIPVPETRAELVEMLDHDPKMLAALCKASTKFTIKSIVTEAIETCDPVSEAECDRLQRGY